jgi:glycerol-3-phosphate dehydrogenase
VVKLGMWLYDRYAADSRLPRRSVHTVGESGVPRVDPDTFRWLCAYHDAQVLYPERLVIAMLEDARRLAHEQGLWFRVLTYRNVSLRGRTVEIHAEPDADAARTSRRGEPELTFEPQAVVNATGAWVDRTLQRWHIDSPRLLGPTKGSHFISFYPPLREALGTAGVYAEAPDGRPVFLLPFGEGTLVGTTDLPFDADPGTAVASDEELDYLVSAARRVFPHAGVARRHIDVYYSGVRPLAAASATSPAAASRDHHIQRHACTVPLFSVVGGKLTTARLVAEQTAAAVLESVGANATRHSRDRVLPGGDSYPADEAELAARQRQLSESTGVSLAQVQAVWRLCGTDTDSLLRAGDSTEERDIGGAGATTSSARLPCPAPFVRHVLRHEWVRHLADLVERRLMLLYDQSLSERTLRDLARLMVDEKLLAAAHVDDEVSVCRDRLRTHYGKQVQPSRGR